LIRKHVSLKELELWLKRGQKVPFFREICSPQKYAPKIGANIGAITGILLRKYGRNWSNNAWHGKCYVKHRADDFPVLGQRDLDASLIDEAFLEEDDPKRFQEGRDGDHLMCPFQCEECHFINIKGCLPEKNNAEDELLHSCMRRANLNAFWSRERSTVYSNMLEGRRFLANHKLLGIASASLSRVVLSPRRISWEWEWLLDSY
jgi:hypothetical protein